MNNILSIGVVLERGVSIDLSRLEKYITSLESSNKIDSFSFSVNITASYNFVIFTVETKKRIEECHPKIVIDLVSLYDDVKFKYAFYTDKLNYNILSPEDAFTEKGLNEYPYMLQVYASTYYDKFVICHD